MSKAVHENFVKAVMTNEKISEDDRSKIIADMMEEFTNNYPNLEHTATKHELKESELRLIKEIEGVKLEIQDVRLEIQDVRLEVATTKSDLIKWIVSLMFAQTAMLIGAFKVFNS